MRADVAFHYHELEFKLKNTRKITRWIQEVIRLEKAQLARIHYIFCSDDFLLNLNQKYLRHNSYTDILTFDYSEEVYLNGDIYISVDRVRENSIKFNVIFEQELRRVIIHGVLHLLGYNDKTAGQKRAMRKKEEACLSLYLEN